MFLSLWKSKVIEEYFRICIKLLSNVQNCKKWTCNTGKFTAERYSQKKTSMCDTGMNKASNKILHMYSYIGDCSPPLACSRTRYNVLCVSITSNSFTKNKRIVTNRSLSTSAPMNHYKNLELSSD